MSRVILARHGESVFSAVGLLNGDPTVPGGLTAQGVAEAEALAIEIASEPIALCIHTEFERVSQTAALALAGRDVPTLIEPLLNDPRYGKYERADLDGYRDWAASAGSGTRAEGGGESRQEIVERYADGYRAVLARPESTILVVAHSLPIAYALAARDGTPPQPRVPLAAYATAYRFERRELERVVDTLDAWLSDPDW
ncbi:MAG: hypothetical protein F2663_02445 [Actinobacteria bacterium]|uniref:Unannotated protein n=1 Tax=freshwater metagenome TaxID=449393 RepID=A0A6J6NMX3_9ZZZZ|nr:hypothetical protein [Actinomycetota bacterium]